MPGSNSRDGREARDIARHRAIDVISALSTAVESLNFPDFLTWHVSCLGVGMNAVARLVNLSKRLDSDFLLDNVSIEFRAGEIVGLVGPNGSGKTTLMNLLSGALQPDIGEIWIQGRLTKLASISSGIAEGIRLLPQFLQTYPSLSVLENIFIGQELTSEWPFPRLMAWRRMRESARCLLQRVGAQDLDPMAPAGMLSGGQQKAVALGRLLARPANLLIFDESTDSLGIKQKARLLDVMKTEAAGGRAVVFISHDIEDVMAVCERIVVMSRGKLVYDQRRDALDARSLAVLMMGVG